MRALALVVMEPSSDEDEDALCVVIDAAPPAKRPKPSAFACAECEKTYTQKHHLNTHIKEKHSETPPSFACDECGTTFTRKDGLNQHIKTKHSATPPSFACDECGKTYTQKGHLNTHIKEKHSANPPSFACDECGNTYTEKSQLTRHMKEKHSMTPPSFACDECGTTFTQKGKLTQHIKEKHSATPPSFACDECGTTYTRQSGLTQHIKEKHSATPPSFACVQCDKTFTRKGRLKEHLAFAHDVGVVWHHCDADPDCDYKAKTGGNLAQHIQSQHARVFAQRKQEQEEHVRRALLDGGWQEYKLAETMPAVGFFRREKRIDFNCAKKAQPGALANAKQFAKIDFVLGVPDGYVFLEVDEHQHRFGYDNESLSCDMKRMGSVQESLAIESGFQLPNLYWLRYNPHAHRANGDLVKVPKAEREARLLAWLKAFAFAAPFGIGYAFYDYDDDGLEVLNHPEYDPQYAALARNLKALEAGSSA